MPTVAQWQQALSHNYRLVIESSTSLCEDVLARQQRREQERRAGGLRPIASKNVIPWPTTGRQQSVSIRPIDLLHALGRITTPPVTELIDLSSTWAEIRYLWAFQPNLDGRFQRSLRLSSSVRRLDFHQKTLLSDEFGVGFAAYFMTVFERATDPVDVFIARRQGQVRLRGRSRRSLPDYIFKGEGQNQYYVVECKGTQSARSTAIGQLQRGSEQILTVDIDPPASVTRLVIGSWLQQAITVFVIDPESEPHVPTLSRWSPKELSQFAGAKRLTYVGEHRGASALLAGLIAQNDGLVVETQNMTLRETGLGTFVGTEQVSASPDGRQIRMFRGVEKELYEEALHGGAAPDRWFEKGNASREGEGFFLETTTKRRSAVVRSISRDGSLFEVQIG